MNNTNLRKTNEALIQNVSKPVETYVTGDGKDDAIALVSRRVFFSSLNWSRRFQFQIFRTTNQAELEHSPQFFFREDQPSRAWLDRMNERTGMSCLWLTGRENEEAQPRRSRDGPNNSSTSTHGSDTHARMDWKARSGMGLAQMVDLNWIYFLKVVSGLKPKAFLKPAQMKLTSKTKKTTIRFWMGRKWSPKFTCAEHSGRREDAERITRYTMRCRNDIVSNKIKYTSFLQAIFKEVYWMCF